MSYMVDKFEAGEVHIRENVCGWYFEESNEFRPLMSDAMKELFDADLISQAHVDATAIAYTAHTEKTLTEYMESQNEFWNNPDNADAQREQLFEMRAAFGEGGTAVNVFTGRKHSL